MPIRVLNNIPTSTNYDAHALSRFPPQLGL